MQLHQNRKPRFPEFIGLELFTPLGISQTPIRLILAKSEHNDERPEAIKRWTEAKSQELQYVGVLGALMAGLLCSAFSWPLASGTIWVVTALWYSGLVFILASVATATQQSITLSRLTCLPKHEEYIKNMLGYETKEDSEIYEPRKGITFIVQIPVMMLRFGVYFFLVGLCVLLGYAAWEQGDIFSSETKTAIMCAVVTAFAICCHAASVFSSYSHWVHKVDKQQKPGHDDGNERAVDHV